MQTVKIQHWFNKWLGIGAIWLAQAPDSDEEMTKPADGNSI